MENKDLGGKKINNEQEINEGFSGENLPENYDPSKGKLKTETENDPEGHEDTVRRARHPDTGKSNDKSAFGDNSGIRENVENQDRNYDGAQNRYPDSHPENHRNRGNMQLDN